MGQRLCFDKERTTIVYGNIKAISGVCQHALVIVDINMKKIRSVVRKTCTERRKISLLKDL